MKNLRWPLQGDALNKLDIEELIDFIRNNSRLTQGKAVREYEEAFSAWQGCKHSLMVNSGSSANWLLVAACKEMFGWKSGDEVIVPALTWPTTLTPVIQLGLRPVFVDATLANLGLDPLSIERAITTGTRAIFVAHLIGFPADLIAINQIARRHNLIVLEDCCESLGAKINGVKVGNFGLGGTFSSYWGHHMTTIEGGMVCTNNDDLYNLMLMKRSHGLARELPVSLHESLKCKFQNLSFQFMFLTDGMNLRSTELNATLGLCQLKRLDEFIRIRNRNYEQFVNLCGRSGMFHSINPPGVSSFVLPFIFKAPLHRHAFEKQLNAHGIESRPLISGNLVRQPFLARYNLKPEDFPIVDMIHHNAFYIGNNQLVDEEMMNGLGELIGSAFQKNNDDREIVEWLSHCTAGQWETLNNARLANTSGSFRLLVRTAMKT